jgi:hypothetical protein
MVGQNRIAASGNNAGRPGPPSGGASEVISLSCQISKDPRFFSEAVQPDRFVARERAGEGFVMRPV